MEEQKYKFGVRYFSRDRTHQTDRGSDQQKSWAARRFPTSRTDRGYTDTLFLGGAIYAGKNR